ncbi:MAG TPA: cytochrome c maturation protein CcmE [Gemmatimonadales bacterium]
MGDEGRSYKFLLGAAVLVSSAGFLIAEGVKPTGVYFLTPAELSAKASADSSVPDTFTDANDIEVIEGRLGRDGMIRATHMLTKCGSRYEAVPKS